MGDAERPDVCQYAVCDEAPAGGLATSFGERWYCLDHYVRLVELLDPAPDVIAGPTATDTATDDTE